jgi:hypothetical protein
MEFTEPGDQQQKTAWLSRVSPVLLSIVLSSLISGVVVSVGWKASIDTLDAVLAMKTQENADKLDKLDRDTVKTSDMVYRDQLLDSKLQLLSIKITTLDDKITELSARKAGR